MKARQTNNRSKERPSTAIVPSLHPGSFALDSLESRAAARALAESRESAPYHCSTCFLTGLGVIGSNQPDFIPNERMEKGPDGWDWKCPKHRDPSREATLQALIKSGLLGRPTP